MPAKKIPAHLFLFAAILFGAVVRFQPVIANGFPLNDGGMFYAMIRELRANHYALPLFTTYNSCNIPFAYPPLGLYAAAFVSDIFSVSEIVVLLWLPALINTLSIFALYQFAEKILNSRVTASLAALAYALSPRSFLWQVMGGGITRAFGMFFMLLMFWQAVQLFKMYSHKNLALTILFGAGAILSHPQTALHAALGGALIFLFYGRNKRGIISAVEVGFGVAFLTSPWWMTVWSHHGLETFLSAAQTSQRTLDFYLRVLNLHLPMNYFALPTLIFFYIGLWLSIRRRDFFFIAWILLVYLIDTRGGDSAAFVAESLLAGIGMLKISAWVSRVKTENEEVIFTKRNSLALVFISAFLFLIGAAIADFQLINTSLKPGDLSLIQWAKEKTSEDETFLLATGREFSMSDPLQEWFPALTNRHSATTLQGLEWTLGDKFFSWYAQLAEFQHCPDINCVSAWSERNGVDADYLVVLIPSKDDTSELALSRQHLIRSSREANLPVAYESDSALVFATNK